jgi:hypothetical protein
MTQRTRTIVSSVLLALSALCMVTFVIQHFMTTRPSWHRDIVFVGLAFAIAAGPVRGRRRAV